mgnify:FL=1
MLRNFIHFCLSCKTYQKPVRIGDRLKCFNFARFGRDNMNIITTDMNQHVKPASIKSLQNRKECNLRKKIQDPKTTMK